MVIRKNIKKFRESINKFDIKRLKLGRRKDGKNGAALSASPNSNRETTDDGIFLFFRENADILAAIGLIGTMISLMPSFLEKLNDDVWLGTFSSFQITSLFLSIVAGIIFIFLLFLTIWDKYYQANVELPFAILLLFFSIFLIAFLLLIYSAILKYLYVQVLLLVIYSFLAYFLICNLKNETKKSKIFSVLVIIFLVILILISSIAGSITVFSIGVAIPDSNNTKIQADVNYYSPLIPQTYGIGFSPTTNKKISFNNYNITWTTDFGYFFIFDANYDRIKYLGNSTINHGQVVYWTYDKEKIGQNKPVVNVSMIIKNQSNETLTTSFLQINWSNIDMAHVIT